MTTVFNKSLIIKILLKPTWQQYTWLMLAIVLVSCKGQTIEPTLVTVVVKNSSISTGEFQVMRAKDRNSFSIIDGGDPIFSEGIRFNDSTAQLLIDWNTNAAQETNFSTARFVFRLVVYNDTFISEPFGVPGNECYKWYPDLESNSEKDHFFEGDGVCIQGKFSANGDFWEFDDNHFNAKLESEYEIKFSGTYKLLKENNIELTYNTYFVDGLLQPIPIEKDYLQYLCTPQGLTLNNKIYSR